MRPRCAADAFPQLMIFKVLPQTADGKPIGLENVCRRRLEAKPCFRQVISLMACGMDVKPEYAVVRFGTLTARIALADFTWTKKTLTSDVFTPGDIDDFQIKELKGNYGKGCT